MSRISRAVITRALRPFLSSNARRALALVPLETRIQYWFFQRVLRVNSHVPWPVHWSSVVTGVDKITRMSHRPYPGFMPGQYIQAINGIYFGKDVRIGPGVKIISANHNLCDYDKHDPTDPIEIGDYCWLGANCVILAGVKLGIHVVVAAGAVVTKSFEGDCVIAGVPAQKMRSLPPYSGTMVDSVGMKL